MTELETVLAIFLAGCGLIGIWQVTSAMRDAHHYRRQRKAAMLRHKYELDMAQTHRENELTIIRERYKLDKERDSAFYPGQQLTSLPNQKGSSDG